MKKSKSLRRLIKSAKMGKPYAKYQLGLIYDEGKQLAQNKELALYLIAEAAELGYLPAKEWIADYAFDDDAAVQAEG